MLTTEQRAELDAVMRKRYGSAAVSRRARCVVFWSDGERRVDTRSKLACNDEFVSKWTQAFGPLFRQARAACIAVAMRPMRATCIRTKMICCR